MQGGFIAMDRGALEHPLLRDGERFRAWFWLIAKAAWKPTRYDIRGQIITLERGQLCTSRSELAEAWGWSESAVERFLTRLKTEQMIGRTTGQGKSIITICNYDKYQASENDTGQATGQATGHKSDSNRTAKEEGKQGNKKKKVASSYEDEPISGANGPRLVVDNGEEKPLTATEVVEAWNAMADRAGLAPIRRLTDARKKHLANRIRDHCFDEWVQAIQAIERSRFCRGDNPRGWRANFDFLLQPSSFTKLLEGFYDTQEPQRRR